MLANFETVEEAAAAMLNTKMQIVDDQGEWGVWRARAEATGAASMRAGRRQSGAAARCCCYPRPGVMRVRRGSSRSAGESGSRQQTVLLTMILPSASHLPTQAPL